MANYMMNLALNKIRGAFVRDIKGSTATKRCVVIPVDELFCKKNGDYVLDLQAVEMKNPKYEDTHVVKQSVPYSAWKEMSQEERDAIPILGGLHESRPRQSQNQAGGYQAATSAPAPKAYDPQDLNPDANDDLPF